MRVANRFHRNKERKKFVTVTFDSLAIRRCHIISRHVVEYQHQFGELVIVDVGFQLTSVGLW